MAFTKKNEQKYTYVLNDVQNVRKWDDGCITFTAIVNGVYIYGLRVIETADDWFVSFPSRKNGNVGKYYKHVYFPIDEDMKALIAAALDKALAE